jgi:hypothetical protein
MLVPWLEVDLPEGVSRFDDRPADDDDPGPEMAEVGALGRVLGRFRAEPLHPEQVQRLVMPVGLQGCEVATGGVKLLEIVKGSLLLLRGQGGPECGPPFSYLVVTRARRGSPSLGTRLTKRGPWDELESFSRRM